MAYKVEVTSDAHAALDDYISYILFEFRSDQAAQSVLDDYEETLKTLSLVAGSIRKSTNSKLAMRGLQRINFRRHDYFMLFKFDGNVVTVTNIFHSSQDYENKLY